MKYVTGDLILEGISNLDPSSKNVIKSNMFPSTFQPKLRDSDFECYFEDGTHSNYGQSQSE